MKVRLLKKCRKIIHLVKRNKRYAVLHKGEQQGLALDNYEEAYQQYHNHMLHAAKVLFGPKYKERLK